MRTSGLQLTDAPPLAIPLSFMLTAPLAIAVAGGTLVYVGDDAVKTGWAPITLSLTHLFTLGFLSTVMMGALYQMIAVVAGSPVPWLRLAHVVHALLVISVSMLCWGTARMSPDPVFQAIGTLGIALLLFLIPVGIALARAPAPDATVQGMRAAVLCFFFAASAGLWMAHGFGGMRFPGPRDLWLQAHLSIALLGWVGGLIVAVSWQILPMFYLTEEQPGRLKRVIQAMTTLGALAPVPILAFEYFDWAGAAGQPLKIGLAWATLPALLSVWVIHPALSLRSLARRRRKRVDGSLLFWRAGLVAAPIAGLTAAAAFSLPDERWSLLFGWLALWSWAGMIVHGMLTRIVPFLVWLHRFAPLIGERAVPSVRALLPDAWTRVGFGLHLASVLLGVAAVLSGWDPLVRATGLALMLTALWLLRSLVHVARQRPEAWPE